MCKPYVDIEIGADIGQVRLYLDDETYETYGDDELLSLINDLKLQRAHDMVEINNLKSEISALEIENDNYEQVNDVEGYRFLKEDIESVLDYIGTNIILNFARQDDTYSLNNQQRIAFVRLSKCVGRGYGDFDLNKERKI